MKSFQRLEAMVGPSGKRALAIGVAAFGVCGLLGWFAFGGGVASWLVVAGSALGALSIVRGELARAQLAPCTAPADPDAQIFVEEGRITLLEPEGHHEVPLDEIDAIWVEGSRRCWLMHLGGVRTVEVPFDAPGADEIPDSLVRLPGFDLNRAARALQAYGARPQLVWRRR